MKTNTFENLEKLCRGKKIVCERRGKKIELTTPCGGTTAECDSLAEAFDTYHTDPAFDKLPMHVFGPRHAPPVVAPELYEYTFRNEGRICYTCTARSLTEACEMMTVRNEIPFTPVNSFHFCGTVLVNKDYIFGVRWDTVFP